MVCRTIYFIKRSDYHIIFTNLGISNRPLSEFRFHTSWNPPTSIVPLIIITIIAPNMSTLCTTSVQTTAFNPPWKKNKLSVKTILKKTQYNTKYYIEEPKRYIFIQKLRLINSVRMTFTERRWRIVVKMVAGVWTVQPPHNNN